MKFDLIEIFSHFEHHVLLIILPIWQHPVLLERGMEEEELFQVEATEEPFAWPWWKRSVCLVPEPAMGSGDGPCHGEWQILTWVKLGKGENLNWQPPHLLQGHQSNFVQVSCVQKSKVLSSLQIPQHRDSYTPPTVG